MQYPFAGQNPFGHFLVGGSAIPARFGPSLRGYGQAVRTAQSLGIEWIDHARQSRDDLLATAGRLAAAQSPAAVVTIQVEYFTRAAERFATHATVCGGLLATLADDLMRQGWGGGRALAPMRVP